MKKLDDHGEMDAHNNVDNQIRAELKKRGLTDEEIRKDIMTVEVVMEKMKDDYEKAIKEGLSDEEAKLMAERAFQAMRKMMGEKS